MVTSSDVDAVGALRGRTVVVTRAREQASRLVDALRDAGAAVVEVPVIAIEPATDQGGALRTALADPSTYEWIVLTSVNGVRAMLAAVDGHAEVLIGARFAAVGPATADALRAHGLEVALVPERFLAEGLLAELPGPSGSGRLLVAQADLARPVLVEGLQQMGWRVDAVTAYRTLPASIDASSRDAIARADAVTFTSASTVENLVAAVGADAVPSVVVSIGPVTTAAAAALGVPVTAEANPHTIDGVVAALVAHYDREPR